MRNLIFVLLTLATSKILAMPFLGGGDSAPTQTIAEKSTKLAKQSRKFSVFVGREFRYERGSNLNYVDRAPVSLHLAYLLKPIWTARVEMAQFVSKTGNATLNYQRQHTDLIAWIDWKPETELPLKPYLGIGLGTFRESVTTRFASEESVLNSEPGLTYGATGGLELLAGRFSLAGELRFLGGDVDPNPLASGLIRVGLQF